MKLLCLDQARHGGWAVFDFKKKECLAYGDFNYDSTKYRFDECLINIAEYVEDLMAKYECDAVYIEDVQMQKNPLVLKQLARLQGALMVTFMKHEWIFDIVTPSQWQGYCKASGRTEREKRSKLESSNLPNGKRRSKLLSMEFVKEHYGVETTNDNIADAICIGHYVVNNLSVRKNGKRYGI